MKKCALFKNNKKAFYAYVKSKQGNNHRVMNLRKTNGSLTKDNEATSEELSTYFKSVYTKEDTSSIPAFRPKNMKKPETKLESIEVTKEEVTKCLLRLNASKSPGPHKMHLMI